MTNGFIIINKPAGMTSSAVVVKARRILNAKKIGHTGTLDPDATGVLPLAVGLATRLFDYQTNKKKTYRAGFIFGTSTDTLDASGTVTETAPAEFTEKQLLQAIKKLTGEIDQIPPAYSAKSVGGVRSYDLARRGAAVELPPKKITVYDFVFTGVSESDGQSVYLFDITCSAGTYIRSLARDTAKLLGTAGHMKSLCRTSSGMFRIEDAVTIENLSAAALIPMEKVLADMPVFRAPDELYEKIFHGVKLEADRLTNLPAEDNFVVYCKGELFGIAEIDEKNRLVIKTYLRTNQ